MAERMLIIGGEEVRRKVTASLNWVSFLWKNMVPVLVLD